MQLKARMILTLLLIDHKTDCSLQFLAFLHEFFQCLCNPSAMRNAPILRYLANNEVLISFLVRFCMHPNFVVSTGREKLGIDHCCFFFSSLQALLKSGATSQSLGADEFIVGAAEILLEQV